MSLAAFATNKKTPNLVLGLTFIKICAVALDQLAATKMFNGDVKYGA
jgi:hypothetical protein